VKHAEILMRLGAHFGNERTQVSGWNKSFGNMKTTFCKEFCGHCFFYWDSQAIFIDFLAEQQNIDAAYYSKPLRTE